MIVAQINIESSVGVLCKTFEPPLSRSVHFSANSLRWLWPFVTSTRGEIYGNTAFNESEFHPVVIFMKKRDYHWFSLMHDRTFGVKRLHAMESDLVKVKNSKEMVQWLTYPFDIFLVSFKLFSMKSFSFEILQKILAASKSVWKL